MGGGKSSSPSAPNYTKLAKTQGEEERKTAEALTASNRPTQNNPYGSINWTKDANGNWTQTENWDPALKKASDSAIGINQGRLDQLSSQGQFNPTDTPTFDPNSGKATGDALYASVMNRAAPKQAQDMEALTTHLRQQGLQPGSEAYDRSMKNLMTSQGDVNTQAGLEAALKGGEEARNNYATQLQGQNQEYAQDLQNYQLPWDIAGASQGLVGGSKTPEFAGFSGATGYQPADMVGAANSTYQAKMGNYSAGQQKKGNLMNTGAQAAATYA